MTDLTSEEALEALLQRAAGIPAYGAVPVPPVALTALINEIRALRGTLAAIDTCANCHVAMDPSLQLCALCVDEDTDEAQAAHDAYACGRRPPVVGLRDGRTECEALRRENMCDACAGTGKPLSGLPCMCGGSGKASDAVVYLRERLFAVEPTARELELAREAVMQAYIETGKTYPDAHEWLARIVRRKETP